MPPKKGKRGSKEPNAGDSPGSSNPKLKRSSSLLVRLRGKDKKDKSPGTSPTPQRKNKGKGKQDVSRESSDDILIADEQIFEAQLPDFDRLAITGDELEYAVKQAEDGSTPDEIAGSMTVNFMAQDLQAEADWEATAAPPRPPKDVAAQVATRSAAPMDPCAFMYIDVIDAAFPQPPEGPVPPPAPFSYLDMIDAATALTVAAR
eukprot:m.90010 g.90010  ORF g.90010 m.90010 type:complete len:204 (+) comp11802_c0_seq3:175-786(+)